MIKTFDSRALSFVMMLDEYHRTPCNSFENIVWLNEAVGESGCKGLDGPVFVLDLSARWFFYNKAIYFKDENDALMFKMRWS